MVNFKAEIVNGEVKIKPNVTKDDKGNVTVHVLNPSV